MSEINEARIRIRDGSPYSFELDFLTGSKYHNNLPAVTSATREDGEWREWSGMFGRNGKRIKLTISEEVDEV